MIRPYLSVLFAMTLAFTVHAGTNAPTSQGIEPGIKSKGAYAYGKGEVMRGLSRGIMAAVGQACAEQNKPFTFNGSLDDVGRQEYHSYAVGDRSVTFTETKLASGTSDFCTWEIRTLRSISLTEWDGKRSTVTEVDLQTNVAKRRYANYRVLNTGVTGHIAGQLKTIGGYKSTGAKEQIAGFECEVVRAQLGEGFAESCVIGESTKRTALKNIVLRNIWLMNAAKPEYVAYKSKVVVFDPDASIDSGVFKLPAVSKTIEFK